VVTITVTRTGSTAASASVNYSTADVSAGTGSDYNGVSGTLSFAPGETSKSFTVRILDDSLSEENETFTIALSGPSNVSAGSPTTATVTIMDNDKIRGRKTPRGGITITAKSGDYL
jgi:FlaG/FlaF family flagellin (archaellin)